MKCASSVLTLALAMALSSSVASAAPWVYRGTLNDGGEPAHGPYDLRLTLLDETRSAAVAPPIVLHGVQVIDGAFAVDVDLGIDPMQASTLYLQTDVQQGDSGFVALGEPVRFGSAAALGSVCWDTAGNAGTTSADFLGTLDAQPLVFRTKNARSLRIEPSAELFTSGVPITTNLIAGSFSNNVTTGVRGATISGGGVPSGDTDPDLTGEDRNQVTDSFGTVAGGYANRAGNAAGTTVDRPFATVSGGRGNTATGSYSAIVGGTDNTASGSNAVVGGGFENLASGTSSQVGGGSGNEATTLWSTVGGGTSNAANGAASTVAGGSGNLAGVGGVGGQGAFVGGGFDNSATGDSSAVTGGNGNCAGGNYSWAGGRSARVRPGNGDDDGTCVADSGDSDGDEGSFLWGAATSGTFLTSGPDQFGVRASGVFFGSVNASIVALPPGRFINTTSGAHLTTGGTWTNASSRHLKTAFKAIDPLAVLGKVADLPISTWTYRDSAEGRHLGPTAEDFQTAFDLGGDGQSIATVDADGVALAAIQGLNTKLEAENAALRADLARIVAASDALKADVESRLRALEATR